MTLLLHTADLHLSSEHPERWEALDAILRLAAERSVDVLLVAGDVLDRGEETHALRARFRNLLESADATVLILPGNHDVDAYAEGQDWGPRTTLLLDRPVGTHWTGGLPLVFLPFPLESVAFSALRPALEEEARLAGGTAILVLHATLLSEGDAWLLQETQEEEPGRYLPVRLEALAELPFAYVAAGHYHQGKVWKHDSQVVAYPGAPAPVGPHALG
ncbi:MAG TPA: metallophosphoesterase, partial [Longimicrobiales bacterium]|nr:metallophosphoesterase [Longimicrobiales bacterium]